MPAAKISKSNLLLGLGYDGIAVEGRKMESFVFSTGAAFVIYELLAYLTPPAANRLQIGEVTVQFGQTSAVLARYILLALAALFLLFFMLGLHRYSPFRNVNVALGFICGPLLGIWLNSIIRLPANQGLGKGQVIGGIGLIVLCIFGSMGNEGADLIKRLASHLSSLKVGIAELSFEDKVPKQSTPGVPSSAGTSKNYSPSQGLQNASALGTFVERDIQYLKLLKMSDPPTTAKLEAMSAFAKDFIEPPLACLSEWSQTDADSASVEPHLYKYAGLFRYLHALKDPASRKEFADQFLSESSSLAADVGLSDTLKNGACRSLLQSYGSWNIEKALDAIAANREFEDRPYLVIAQASLLAQLGQYPAVGSVLDGWLRDRASASSKPSQPNPDWFELRARSFLAAYIEEWVDRDETSVTTRLRREHLKNLDVLRQGLRQALTGSAFFSSILDAAKKGGTVTFVEPGACRYGDAAENPGDWRLLFTSYISMELTYDQNTLLFPLDEYDTTYAEQTSDDLRQLVQTDLSCVADNFDAKVFYAQFLEAFGRNAIMYVEARGDSESAEAKASTLNDAMIGTIKGLELVKGSVEDDQSAMAGKPYLVRIAPSDALLAQEALTSNLRRLKALTEE